MYKVFGTLNIKKHLIVFILNIIALVVNASLLTYSETLLQYQVYSDLINIQIISSVTTIINILNIIMFYQNYNMQRVTLPQYQSFFF